MPKDETNFMRKDSSKEIEALSQTQIFNSYIFANSSGSNL